MKVLEITIILLENTQKKQVKSPTHHEDFLPGISTKTK